MKSPLSTFIQHLNIKAESIKAEFENGNVTAENKDYYSGRISIIQELMKAITEEKLLEKEGELLYFAFIEGDKSTLRKTAGVEHPTNIKDFEDAVVSKIDVSIK
jgi:hypothetical protein